MKLMQLKRLVIGILSVIGGYFVFVGGFAVLMSHFMNPSLPYKNISFSDFISSIEANRIEFVVVEGEEYKGKFQNEYHDGAYTDGTFFETQGPQLKDKTLELLRRSGARIEYRAPKSTPLWKTVLFSHFPLLLVGTLIGFFLGRRQRSNI